MNTDTQVNKLIDRLDQVDKNLSFMDMVGTAITKTTFHFKARKFIKSLIRQREVILQNKAGHKNPSAMYKAIDHLRINLEAFGEKDLSMARFFLINEEEIRSIIPGSYPNKQFDEFIMLRDEAYDIKNRQP